MIPHFGEINNPLRKELLSTHITRIRTPSVADVCQIILNARSIFGADTHLFLFRVDVSEAFHRTRLKFPSILLMAMHLLYKGIDIILLPLTQRWGEQGSNYWWQIISVLLLACALERMALLSSLPLVAMYIDDFFGCLPPHLAETEIKAFTRDAVDRIGVGAVKDAKTISDEKATIIGWLFDTRQMSMSINDRSFLKLVCLLFVETPAVLEAGSTLPIRHLQRLGSFAIRYSNAIVLLLPYSRGFHNNLKGITST